MLRAMILLAALAGSVVSRPSAAACPPSCPNNELLQLLDQFCSDKVRLFLRARRATHKRPPFFRAFAMQLGHVC